MAWTTEAYAADGSTWTQVTDIAAAAASDKPIAITMTKGTSTWVLPTTKVTSNPGPTAVTATVTDGKLNTTGAASDYGWTITESNGKYTITNEAGLYLYVTADNKGVRVNNKPSVGYEWSITSNYLTATASDGTRYLGVYNSQDWRCYTSINTNITGQALQFWELESGVEAEQPVAYWPLIEDDIVDGAIVVIHHPDSGTTLSRTASGAILMGMPTTFNDNDELGLLNSMVQLDVREENGLFTFVTTDEKYLTCPATGKGLSFTDTESDYTKWTLEKQTDGTWYIINNAAVYNGSQQALEYYSGFTTFGVKDNNAAYKFEFYGDNGTPVDPPQGPFTVTVQQAEHGTITASKTENIAYNEEITITMTPDEGYVADKLFVNGAAINPADTNGVVTVKITENTTVTGEFKADTPAVEYDTIAEALAGAANTQFTVKGVVTLVDGKNIYIQDETGGIDLYFSATPSGISLGDTIIGKGVRDTYNGLPELKNATFEASEGMTLTAKETTIGALTNADLCTYVSIKNLTVTEINGNNTTVTDANGGSIKIFKAVSDGLAVDDVIDFKGAIGIYSGALQLRNTLASEITIKGNEPGPYDEYDATKNVYELTDTLETGDKVLIYNAGSTMAVTSTLKSNYYLEGKSFTTETVSENLIIAATPQDAAVSEWTVKVNEDGTYTFTQDDKTLAGKQNVVNGSTKNNLTLSADDQATWTLNVCNADNKSYYVYNPGMTSAHEADGAHVYLEWFAKYTEFSLYDTSKISEDAFGMTFYKLVRPATEDPNPPTGDTFGLTSTLNTGDEVILYNAGSGMAVGNTIVSHKVQGVALTPAEGVITTDKTNVVWTVTKNEDGTYTFTQGTNTLGGITTVENDKTYNNLVLTDGTYTNWKLTGPDSEDFNYYMYLNGWSNNYGNFHLEYYNDGFTVYAQSNPTKDQYGVTFYKKGAEPETPSGPVVEGDLVTSLSQLTDGATVAIYSPTHKTAISSKANGDWYLKANPAIVEDGKVKDFTSDFVWKVKVNDNGTYSFYSNDKEGDSISVWPSVVNGKTYAELTVNTNYDEQTVNEWVLSPFNSQNHTWYVKSSTLKISNRAVYVEAYVRNGGEVFSGYAPYPDEMTDTNYALQFYLVDPADAVAEYDDGEWDGILTAGEQYVMYSDAAKASVGLFKEANYSMDAIPTTIVGDKANPGNGAYVFTVGTTGRYYTFEVGGKYLASNDEEELLFVEANEDGSIPGTAKWYLSKPSDSDGYVVFNKTANYKGSPVCIEYYSSVFSGWTYKANAEDTSIFYFDFYKVTDDTDIHEGVVQDPSVIFDCEDSRYIEQDFPVTITLDDLADEITDIEITFTAGTKTGTITDYEVSSDGKNYTFTIPASEIDVEEGLESFELNVNVVNSYGIEYEGSKTVAIVDEPFFEDLTPAPNSQTRDDKRPVVSARVGNVGEEPTFTLKLNDEVITDIVYENGILSYTPTEDMEDGRVNVLMTVTRKDGVSAEKSWNFTVGISDYQLYFGQLHSHTTYSDGSGTLETALDYIGSLPESANVQFVAFTDHSNYFDAPNAANPADALNDKSLMTAGSLADWNTYKETIAAFNDKQSDVIAIGGFEMTWSGGPGHINTYDSDGLVSRNNALLNNKTNDAGMKLYYETINKGESLSQFNHPGTTFGNFTDFSYWNEETDAHMFLVEVGNGEGQIGAGGYYPSYEQYTLALDQGWHLAPTNNQDNHKGRWGNANDARDVILTNDFSEKGIYNAIRDMRVYATEDKNLQISYTMNDEPMGTIFKEENTPETLKTVITVYDPNNYDGTAKVELVANGGVVAKTWDSAEELAEGLFTAELTPEYGYYFVRVTQEDGDIAVTAPIWTGLDVAVGIKEVKVATEQPLVNQPMTINTTLFNNEEDAVNVKSLTYTVDGSTVIGTDTDGHPIAAGDEITVPFEYTPTVAKRMTVTVTAVFTVGDKEVTYSKDVTFSVRENDGDLPVTDIDVVNSQSEAGYEYAIEGIVTSNASGYDKDTAFFDCIYVQDATGGICCFPVSGEYKIGDKVHIEGYTDFYQGEPELQVTSIAVIGSGEITPTEVSAEMINNRSVLGSLVTVKGTVQSFEVVNGLIQTIMVEDSKGDIARVFIDGYITTQNEVKNCEVGAEITVTGISSYDDTFNAPEGPFPRIRIRNRADIVCKVEEPTVNITVSKIWDTVDMEAPQGVTVTFGLNANGIDTGYTVSLDGVKDSTNSNPVVSETAPWEATFAGLDKFDSNGNEIVYSVREIGSVPGFTTSYPNGQNYALNGEAITNTQEITSVTVSKAWVNADGTTTAPEGAAVKFTLYADGEDTGFAVTLTGQEDGNPIMQGGQEHEPWTAVFVRLPKYKLVNGAPVEINYTVTETETWPGYEVSYGAEDATFAVDGGTITNTEKPAEPTIPHLRVMGSSRYDTAFQAANYMKTVKGIDQFDTVVVAYGVDFADALSGSYLAAVAEAPILLVHPKYEGDVLKYIGHNVKPEGKVYLLGGTSVVSEAFEQQLKNASFDVKRLGGADRFETNLLILEEGNALGGDASEVLVASATRFADALSTSSVGKPILLAGAKLTADQQDYLREAQPKNAWIVGGTSAVNATVEADLKNFVADGGIKRFEGGNRYETSYMVAHEFFPGECETAILVYGQNFPDGLSGGAVASVIGAPVLLAMDRDDMIANVAKWVQESGATKSVTFGGPTLVTDNNVRTIMADPEAEIVLFE